MNKKARNNTKKIIIILIIVTFCNFIVPKISFAVNGGQFFKPIAQSIAHASDIILGLFQGIFTGNKNLAIEANIPTKSMGYYILYSPGIIFSGKVPALDINFIHPIKEGERKYIEYYDFGEYYNKDLVVQRVIPKILGMYGKSLYIGDDELNRIIKEIREKYNETDMNKIFYDGTYDDVYYYFVYKNKNYEVTPYKETRTLYFGGVGDVVGLKLKSYDINEHGYQDADTVQEVIAVEIEDVGHYHDFLDDFEIEIRELLDKKDPKVEVVAKTLENQLKSGRE